MKIPQTLRWKPTGETLGEGGQSQVYLVKDKDGDDSVKYALKALKRNEHGQAYQRFYQEIEAIKLLNHPNIIQIIDHSDHDSQFHFYVMEYIKGAKSLSQVIDSNSNPYFCKPAKKHRFIYPGMQVYPGM